MAAGGYLGQALAVDAATGTSSTLPLPDQVLRAYIGGAGLGAWLLYRLGTPGADALDATAPLAFVFSPLVGTPLTTSAKFAVVAKSPLTGMLTDALASSQFAIAGKLTGHDAIVVRGRAPQLSVLLVDGDGTRLIDARQLAGCTAAETDKALREQLGRGWRMAAIGPAAERGVRYATISHDGRHAGRGGLGAVMGAKNLKAIAVRAAGRAPAAAWVPAAGQRAGVVRARAEGGAGWRPSARSGVRAVIAGSRARRRCRADARGIRARRIDERVRRRAARNPGALTHVSTPGARRVLSSPRPGRAGHGAGAATRRPW